MEGLLAAFFGLFFDLQKVRELFPFLIRATGPRKWSVVSHNKNIPFLIFQAKY